jgi:rare lipoprotein A (peptidoglycan hydrolase)
VDVTVTDVGPAKRPRRRGVIIDLSKAAAERLGFTHDGKAKVRVDVLEMASADRK